MAIIPSSKYSGQITTGDAGYPLGKAKNVTVAGDGTGTPLEADWVNDIWGLLQGILSSAGVTASGSPDNAVASQYLGALKQILVPAYFDNIPDTYTKVLEATNDHTVYLSSEGFAFARDADWVQGTGWVSGGANPGVIELLSSYGLTNVPQIRAQWGTPTAGTFPNEVNTPMSADYFAGHPRAMGKITTGNPAVIAYNHYGIASIAQNASTSLLITLDDTFAGPDEMIINGTCENPFYTCIASPNGSSTSFLVYVALLADGTIQTISGAGAISTDINLVVHGALA